ncbi:MAG: hypothetical protein AAFN77_20775 [Planctomycetota bacterium]
MNLTINPICQHGKEIFDLMHQRTGASEGQVFLSGFESGMRFDRTNGSHLFNAGWRLGFRLACEKLEKQKDGPIKSELEQSLQPEPITVAKIQWPSLAANQIIEASTQSGVSMANLEMIALFGILFEKFNVEYDGCLSSRGE